MTVRRLGPIQPSTRISQKWGGCHDERIYSPIVSSEKFEQGGAQVTRENTEISQDLRLWEVPSKDKKEKCKTHKSATIGRIKDTDGRKNDHRQYHKQQLNTGSNLNHIRERYDGAYQRREYGFPGRTSEHVAVN
jgi:hypothetical protein